MEHNAVSGENHTHNSLVEPPAVARLRAFYEHFGPSALVDIPSVYDDAVVFEDPIHRVEGLAALQAYFGKTTANVTQCAFHFHNVQVLPENAAWITWRMDFAHPRLRAGTPLAVEGVTHLRFGERITYHRDYFDLGSMLYEHVPLIGGAVRWLKGRLGS